MPYPRFLRAKQHKFATRTSGSLTPGTSSGGFTDVTSAMDLTLRASVGDTLRFSLTGLADITAGEGGIIPWTFKAGVATNPFIAGLVAAPKGGFYIQGTRGIGGSLPYTVTAGDIHTDGTVTVRMRYSSSAALTLYATTTYPLLIALENIGPAAS